MSITTLRRTAVLLLFPFLVLGCEFYRQEQQGRELLEKCRELEVGMTREQVTQLMGEPRNTLETNKEGKIEEWLYFVSPVFSAEQTQCAVDKESGLVVEVICGEGYRKTEDGERCDRIRKGMTRDQVIEIMGEPILEEEKIMNGRTEEWLYFASRRFPKRGSRCILDKKSGVVIATYCSEFINASSETNTIVE